MFSYENISFVYKVHSPQLNTEQSQLEWRVQDSYKQLFKTLTNSCSRLLQTVVQDSYKQLFKTLTNSCLRLLQIVVQDSYK